MKEFMCGKCLKPKKIELYSHTVRVNNAPRKVCTHCADKINKANQARG